MLSNKKINISDIYFLLLFPGFFFYNFLISRNYMPPILGGYFGNISLIIFPFLFIFFYIKVGGYKREHHIIDILFYIVMTINVIIALLNYSWHIPQHNLNGMLVSTLSLVLFNLTTYFLAKTISIDSDFFFTFMIIILLIMGGLILSNIGENNIFSINMDKNKFVSSYQGMARSIVIINLLLISKSEAKFKFLLFIVGAIILFYNGARTEFFLFVLAGALLWFYNSSIKLISKIFLFILLIFLLISINKYNDLIINIIPQNRTLALIDHFEKDNSLKARIKIQEAVVDTISNNPITGDYGNYKQGENAHNILSAWVDLGLIGFLFYILIITYLMEALIIRLLNNIKINNIVLVFVVFTIPALILSKGHSYMFFGFTVGIFSRFSYLEKDNKNKYNF